MAIEIPDLDTWNAWLEGNGTDECGCCGMTECDPLDHECQNKSVSITPCGVMVGVELGDYIAAEQIEVPCADQCAWFSGFRTITENTFAGDDGAGKTYSSQGNGDYHVTYVKDGQDCNETGALEETGSLVWTYADNSRDEEEWWYRSITVNGVITEEDGEITVTTYDSLGNVTGSSTSPYTGSIGPMATLDTWVRWTASGTEDYDAAPGGGIVRSSGTVTSSTEFIGELGAEKLEEQAKEELDEEDWADVTDDDSPCACFASRSATNEECDGEPVEGTLCWSGLDETIVRFRWKVPYPWERSANQKYGSYFVVRWDLLWTPKEWTDYETDLAAWQAARDAWVAEDPENREPGGYTVDEPSQPEPKQQLIDNPGSPWTWSYPTDPDWVQWVSDYEDWIVDRDAWVAEDPDNRQPGDYPTPSPTKPAGDDPWYSGWFGFKVPESFVDDDLPKLGRVDIVNAKFMCYHGAVYGAKPQIDENFEEFDRHPDR